MLVVYTKNNCQPCATLKASLKQKGIEFTEVNVSLDAEAVAMLKRAGHKSVPVMYKDGVHFTMPELT